MIELKRIDSFLICSRKSCQKKINIRENYVVKFIWNNEKNEYEKRVICKNCLCYPISFNKFKRY